MSAPTCPASEAALARFVLDEDVKTSGSIYANNWELAGYQIRQLAQAAFATTRTQDKRVDELEALYRTRGGELALAARAAIQRQGQAGIGYFYQAGLSPTGPQARRRRSTRSPPRARRAPRRRSSKARLFSAEADRFTDYLSWLGVIIGLGAIFLGVVAVQALRQNAASRRQAESESERAEALEHGGARPDPGIVGGQPGAEGRGRGARRRPKRSCARSRKWRRSAS